MTPTIERITESSDLGEAPFWDADTQSLYYVDIFGKYIHKYIPSTKKHTKAYIGKQVGFIVPVEGSSDRFLLGMQRDLVIVTWDGASSEVSKFEKILDVDSSPAVNTNNFNDGKTDATGRLWAGTMGPDVMNDKTKRGTLYSFGPNKQVKSQVSNVHISNGLAFSPDSKKFYYIDSGENRVDQFDMDIKTGTLSNRQPVFTFDKHNIPGFPDGQAVDAEGNLWVAVFNGSRVVKIDPRKPETLLATIDMPAKQITCVAFGGQDLDELYVTTAKFPAPGEVLLAPENGAVYKVTGLGVKGLPGVRVKI